MIGIIVGLDGTEGIEDLIDGIVDRDGIEVIDMIGIVDMVGNEGMGGFFYGLTIGHDWAVGHTGLDPAKPPVSLDAQVIQKSTDYLRDIVPALMPRDDCWFKVSLTYT